MLYVGLALYVILIVGVFVYFDYRLDRNTEKHEWYFMDDDEANRN